MSGKTGIAWTDATWNPVSGCTRVSSGCNNCYAFQLHDQRHVAWKRGRWDAAPAQYHLPFSKVQLLPERLDDPFHWRKPRRVFVNSMSDLCHEQVDGGYITRVFEVMRLAKQHTFQVLTKRPERMLDFCRTYYARSPEPLPNVWLGSSVEDQAAANERIPYLLQTPAAVRFLSCEPLLSAVDLWPFFAVADNWGELSGPRCDPDGSPAMKWVILGGESGPHARPMNLDWVRLLIEQCREAGAKPFVKQLGTVWAREHGAKDHHGGNPDEWPEDLRVREYPSFLEPARP